MKYIQPLLYLVCGLWLAGCTKADKPAPIYKYTSPKHGFSVTAPDDPVVYPGLYRFFSDKSGKQLLLEVQVTSLRQPNERSADSNLDVYERAYRGEPGAVVAVHPIALQGAPGREFDITAGPHSPSRKRIYVANKTYYFIEFNPNTPGAADVADSFQFEFPVQ